MTAHAIADEALVLAESLARLVAGRSDEPAAMVRVAASLGRIRQLTEQVGVSVAGRIAELYDEPGDRAIVRGFGEHSAPMVLQAYAGVDAVEAQNWVRVGAAVRPRVSLLGEELPPAHPMISHALESGRLHVSAAARILDVLDEIAPNSSVTEREQIEQVLVEAAPNMTARQFVRLCRSVPPRFQPENITERERQLRAKAGITVRQGDDGLVHIRIKAHPEAAGFILTALNAVTAPRRGPVFVAAARDADGGAGADGDADGAADDGAAAVVAGEPEVDRRPLSVRRLDALQLIARDFLGRDHGVVAGSSVTMRVTVTHEALLTGIGTAGIDGIDEPISAGTARRLASDADVIPVVLGGPSEPLDLGRLSRLASGPQRDALAIRDGGCIWPGCSAPPGWCEVAHIRAWVEGGATDLSNLMLLCPFHHRCFDTAGWQLEVRDGRRCFIPPPWIDAARTPRPASEPVVLAA